MKTKKQVEHFLRKRKYKSEIDFKGISSYCKTEYNIKLHVPSSYSDDPESLDYATFANWFDKGFGAGDAVKWNDSIGLVQEGNVNTVLICLRIDGNTPNFDKITIPVYIITPAGENALNRLYLVLDENGQEFGNPFFVISDKYIPKSCDLVCFHNHKTGQEGYGVVRLVDKSSGDIVMYCYVIKGEPVKYSMNEYLGKIDDFSFTTFKPADYQRKALDVELAKVGMGYVNDLVVDICCGRVTALIVPGPCRFLGLFGREDDYVIPWLCIKRIGDDLILVDGPLSEWRTPRKKRSLF